MARKMKPWARLVLCGDGKYEKLMPPKNINELRNTLKKRSRLENRGYKTKCQIWVGCKDSCGYGVLRFLGRNQKIGRLSWLVNHGPVPEKSKACHKCDQPDCFNIEHLFTGTHLENMTDAKIKKRMTTVMGESHYCHKLSESQVRILKAEFNGGLKVTKMLALKYKVSKNALHKIRLGKSWKHI